MIFIKPDGREIEVNESSAEYAESIGWKRKGAEKAVEVVKAEDPQIEVLRQKYLEKTGQKPHHRMSEETLIKAIEG